VALAAALFTIIGVLWRVSGSLALQSPAPPLAKQVTTSNAVPPNPAAAGPLPKQLELAANALVEGRHVEPVGSSALDLYRSVLQSDPDNETARSGIRTIADQFLQRAEQALLADSLGDAERILQLVHSIEADHPRLSFLDSRVSRERELRSLTARREVANRVRQLVGEARRDMLAGDLIGTAAGGALDALLAARKLDPADAAVVQTSRELNVALADAVRMAVTAGDASRTKAFASAVGKLGAGEQLLAAIDRSFKGPKRNPAPPSANPSLPTSPSPSAPAPQRTEEPIVAKVETNPAASTVAEVLQAFELPRIREIKPSYPRDAQREGIEGYVDLEFTISTEGIPRNLEVVAATPKRVFESAAINCLRQWRFEPIKQNGLPATPRAILRVRFVLQ
jgi:protein TonB